MSTVPTAPREGKKIPRAQYDLQQLRLTARRTGLVRAVTARQWSNDGRRWRDLWKIEDGPPAFARVGVWRKGDPRPHYVTAGFHESAEWGPSPDGPSPTPEWMQWGHTKLADVAETEAILLAIPEAAEPALPETIANVMAFVVQLEEMRLRLIDSLGIAGIDRYRGDAVDNLGDAILEARTAMMQDYFDALPRDADILRASRILVGK